MSIQNLVLVEATAGPYAKLRIKLLCLAIVLVQLAAEIVAISALVHVGWSLV
jgi:hypothetical protein